MGRPPGLPEEFLERLRALVPPSRWQAIVRTFEEPPPATFRINRPSADPRAARTSLAADGFHAEPVAWCPGAFILRRGRLRDLQRTALYADGSIYVQSLSSLVPPLVMELEPGLDVLDLAAAPGSKTTQIACLMQGQGRLVANDQHRIRFFKLCANVRLQGLELIDTVNRYGEWFGTHQPDAFDRVLVDAPCSTEGRFQLREPASFRFWSRRKIHEMAHKQRRLLRAGLAALRPGGVLVYATCTFAPEENEAVLDHALGEFRDRVRLEPVRLPFANVLPGLARWEDRAFDPAVRLAVRILPTQEMEGFFVAKFRKVQSEAGR
ncbi:MAG TPA: RsmB/NOP family class I SAM-dependent RNA methyltransferase [bacterium]